MPLEAFDVHRAEGVVQQLLGAHVGGIGRLRLLVRDLVDTQHLTALLVTHDLNDIANLADRVVLYEPGHTTATHDLPTDSADHIAHLLGLTS